MNNIPYRILFLGTPAFAVSAFEALLAAGYDLVCVTQPDKPVGRHRDVEESPVKRAAQQHHVPVLQPKKLDEQFLASLKEFGSFIVGVIVAYGKILRAPMLTVPDHGFLNIHASLLPRHRGASPIQSAILAGDTETGVTIMRLDEGLDTGPIVAQQRIPLAGTETAGELFQRLAPVGAHLLIHTLPSVLDGTASAQPQDIANATLTTLFTKNDARLAWKETAQVLERTVRAFNPEPVAWTALNGKRINVLRASLAGERSQDKPGTLVVIERLRMLGVTCGDGNILALELVHIEGKNPADGAAFFHGYRKRAGSVLG